MAMLVITRGYPKDRIPGYSRSWKTLAQKSVVVENLIDILYWYPICCGSTCNRVTPIINGHGASALQPAWPQMVYLPASSPGYGRKNMVFGSKHDVKSWTNIHQRHFFSKKQSLWMLWKIVGGCWWYQPQKTTANLRIIVPSDRIIRYLRGFFLSTTLVIGEHPRFQWT